jgi:hypothetical protein
MVSATHVAAGLGHLLLRNSHGGYPLVRRGGSVATFAARRGFFSPFGATCAALCGASRREFSSSGPDLRGLIHHGSAGQLRRFRRSGGQLLPRLAGGG